ncbi:MAG: hypothetical protein EPO32_06420 [Anaerolineae bacterium]|nr:MAG: hypothetical protein EPO32_06420 [Anaerolineae bacterium]
MSNSHNPGGLTRRELLKLLGLGGAALLAGCASPETLTGGSPTPAPFVPTVALEPTSAPATRPPTGVPPTVPAQTATPAPGLAELLQPLSLDPLPADAWKSLPVYPDSLSARMRRVFEIGMQQGRDPRRFSVIGDCQSIPTYFLTEFEGADGVNYFLGENYAGLQPAVDWFKGSFGGGSATQGGQNVAAVFSPLWADPNLCAAGEGPLACELRINRSAFALISLEENWAGDDTGYRENLEKIVQYTLGQAVIPVLATKASNLEGDHSINRAIVETARAYEVPLWNFWASLQSLPEQGLYEDRFHLTQGAPGRFDYRGEIRTGWAMRNLTALQVLDALRRLLELG